MRPKSIYHCSACHGSGEEKCSECGQDVECDTCDGSGFDKKMIAVPEMQKAKMAMLTRTGKLSLCVDGEVMLGWKSPVGEVLIADYVIEGREERLAEQRRQAALALEPTLFPMGPDL